eukprot:4399212-Pyramimonas_sp.AAC.1
MAFVGVSWGPSETIGLFVANIRALWGNIGALLGRPQTVWGASWAVLGRHRRPIGPSRALRRPKNRIC